MASAPALREELLGLIWPGASRLVIDLSAAGFADASGAAVLVGAGRRARLLGGWLRLVSPAPEVTRVLSATGLDQHLATFATAGEAITGIPAGRARMRPVIPVSAEVAATASRPRRARYPDSRPAAC